MTTTLEIVGWIFIAIGCLLGLGVAFDSGHAEYLTPAIAGLISGIVFLALGAIVEKLHEIERHLRPAGTSIPDAAIIYCACGQMTAQRAKERGHICA